MHPVVERALAALDRTFTAEDWLELAVHADDLGDWICSGAQFAKANRTPDQHLEVWAAAEEPAT